MGKKDFIETRRGDLERYLNRLAHHPAVGRSEVGVSVCLCAVGWVCVCMGGWARVCFWRVCVCAGGPACMFVEEGSGGRTRFLS